MNYCKSYFLIFTIINIIYSSINATTEITEQIGKTILVINSDDFNQSQLEAIQKQSALFKSEDNPSISQAINLALSNKKKPNNFTSEQRAAFTLIEYLEWHRNGNGWGSVHYNLIGNHEIIIGIAREFLQKNKHNNFKLVVLGLNNTKISFGYFATKDYTRSILIGRAIVIGILGTIIAAAYFVKKHNQQKQDKEKQQSENINKASTPLH